MTRKKNNRIKEGDTMRKQTKVILSVIILLALLAATFAAVFYYRHEQEQNRAIHELNEQVIGLLEE